MTAVGSRDGREIVLRARARCATSGASIATPKGAIFIKRQQ